MSRTGKPSRNDEIAADDLLIDGLATAPHHSDVTVDDGRCGQLARLLMTLHCLAGCRLGAYGHGGALDRHAAGAMVERQANPGGPTCRRHIRSAMARLVEARSCLDVVIATIPAQRGPSDHHVSAAIAAAIAALDFAFEDWHDSAAGKTAVTDVAPLRAVPADRALGGGVP